MKKVLIIGSINMDLVAQIDTFPKPGETVKGNSFTQHPGGKGANQASACIKQNSFTSLWGKVGKDSYGSEMKHHISDLGINSFIDETPVSTGIALIEIAKSGQNRIVIIGGANDCFTLKDIDNNINIIKEHDIIVIQFEIPLEVCKKIAYEAHRLNKIVVCNPAPAVVIDDEFLSYITYLIPNEHELAIISQLPTDTQDQMHTAMLSLKTKGVQSVITTLGSEGYCYTTKQNTILYHPSRKTDVIDTTGAGDAFIGAFAGYLAKNLSTEEALECANIVASISVTRFGAFGSAGSEEEVKKIK